MKNDDKKKPAPKPLTLKDLATVRGGRKRPGRVKYG